MKQSLHDVLLWLTAALRTWPEEPDFPEDLEEAPVARLAEARSRLQEASQAATLVRRQVDSRIRERIGPHGAVRYGDRLLRPSLGDNKVVDVAGFWSMVDAALRRVEDPIPLLRELFNVDSVRLSGLPLLANVLEVDPKTLRSTLVDRSEPTSPISAISQKYWPMWALSMGDGEAYITRATPPEEWVDPDVDREPPVEVPS